MRKTGDTKGLWHFKNLLKVIYSSNNRYVFVVWIHYGLVKLAFFCHISQVANRCGKTQTLITVRSEGKTWCNGVQGSWPLNLPVQHKTNIPQTHMRGMFPPPGWFVQLQNTCKQIELVKIIKRVQIQYKLEMDVTLNQMQSDSTLLAEHVYTIQLKQIQLMAMTIMYTGMWKR